MIRKGCHRLLSASEIAVSLQCEFGIAIHPIAVISSDATIHEGTVVMQGAIIQTETVIGKHSIINTKASVDHECIIGDFVHIAPGVPFADRCV